MGMRPVTRNRSEHLMKAFRHGSNRRNCCPVPLGNTRVLWVTCIVVFLNRLSVGPPAPFFKDDLGITSIKAGLDMSAAAFGYTLSMLPIGWAGDRIGARLPMVTGELIAGAVARPGGASSATGSLAGIEKQSLC